MSFVVWYCRKARRFRTDLEAQLESICALISQYVSGGWQAYCVFICTYVHISLSRPPRYEALGATQESVLLLRTAVDDARKPQGPYYQAVSAEEKRAIAMALAHDVGVAAGAHAEI